MSKNPKNKCSDFKTTLSKLTVADKTSDKFKRININANELCLVII